MANIARRQDREVSRPPSSDYRSDYRWDPFRVIDTLLRPALFSGDWSGLAANTEFMPRFDVQETKDAFVFRADLPGVKEEDVDVSLNGSQLTIAGKREEETREGEGRYYAMERTQGSFARSFSLPDMVDAEHVSADLRNGVLTVSIPKSPEAQPKRISVGKGSGSAKA
jgi:HSP20 family protein